jgi:type I restriction enzyme R subunit
MNEIATNIFTAFENGILPPFVDINKPNNERKGLVSIIANRPELRRYLLILNAGFVNILQPGEDNLISKGFSQEEAQETTSAFEEYCNEHKDDIEALRMIYNNSGEPLTYSLLKDLENKLKMANNKLTCTRLWNSYSIINPAMVKSRSTKEEKEALTNIIQLVRYAFHHIQKLESLYPSAQSLFNLWYGKNKLEITEKQVEIIRGVVNFIASNGSCNINDIREDNKTYAAQLIKAFGGKDNANEALLSLATFIIYRKTA